MAICGSKRLLSCCASSPARGRTVFARTLGMCRRWLWKWFLMRRFNDWKLSRFACAVRWCPHFPPTRKSRRRSPSSLRRRNNETKRDVTRQSETERDASETPTRQKVLSLGSHSFFERSCGQGEAKMIAHVLDAICAGRIQIPIGAFGFDHQGSGFGAHYLAIALRIAGVNEKLNVASHV